MQEVHISDLPQDILQDIFTKSENIAILPLLSKSFYELYNSSKSHIVKQIFKNHNLHVELEYAMDTYIEFVKYFTSDYDSNTKIDRSLETLLIEFHSYDIDTFNYHLTIVSEQGLFNIVKLILSDDRTDIDMYISDIFKVIENGYINIIKLLLDRGIDIFECDNFILEEAIEHQRNDIFNILVSSQYMKPEYIAINLLEIALNVRNSYIIDLLLNKYKLDSTINNYECLRNASRKDDNYAINILLSDTHIDQDMAQLAITEAEFTYITDVNSRRYDPRICSEYVNFEQNLQITIESMQKKLYALDDDDWSDYESLENERRVVRKVLKKLKSKKN